ncbi:MAG TPA: POTRA domain-containing protein [Kofleriaceae bacterium]|nr:POTRA domain-containing protein [Kofleriaceae bacterium]
MIRGAPVRALLVLAALALPTLAPAQPAQPQPAEPETTPVPAPTPAPTIEGETEAEGDAEPEPEPETETEPESERDAPDLTGAAPPPERWQSFDVEGDLLERPETVRAFLEPRMARTPVLDAERVAELRAYCLQIGYYLREVRTERKARGAVTAVLVLRPVTTIYQIKVDIDNLPQSWYWPTNWGAATRAFFETIFSDQVRRRMRLRQGSQLPDDIRLRARLRREEERRIEDFLRNEGYFDATARITEVPRSTYSVTLEVEIDKGERYQVGDIQVSGNTAIASGTIRNMFHHAWFCPLVVCLSKGGFSRQQLQKDVQSLITRYQNRGYPGVRVRTDYDPKHSFRRDSKTVNFNVYITERQRVDVEFQGNDKKSAPDDQLRKQLTFNAEGAYDQLEREASVESLRRYYQERGYFEVAVTSEVVPKDFHDLITFTIEEGPKLPVLEISFVGNHVVDTSALSDTIRTKVFRQVAVFGGGGGYTTSLQLEQDVNRVLDVYRRRGFSEAKVRARVARDRRVQGNAAALAAAVAGQLDAKGLYLQFIIDEGPQQTIESVGFVFSERDRTLASLASDPVKRAEAEAYYQRRLRRLSGAVGARAGDPYIERRLSKDKAALARFYFERGHPHAVIDYTVAPGASPHSTRVVWNVTENPLITFGRVAIRGNFHTRGWIIRDELGFDDGDVMTLARAERAQQNLRTSGLFKSVSVTYPDFDDTNQDTLNVLVQVQERERINLEIAGGLSSDSGAFIEGALSHRNVIGLGMRADARAHVGQELLSGELKMVLPRWLGRRMSFGAIAFTTEAAVFARREATVRFGDLDSFGTSVALSKAGSYGFFRGWVAALRYDLRVRFREVELVRPAGPSDDLSRAPVPTVTGSVGPQVIIDRRRDADGRPNPLLPGRGYQLEVHAAYADPVLSAPVALVGQDPGRDRFIKLGGSAQHFWKPSKRTLIQNGVRYDHGVPLGNEFLLPEVERFFAGGDTTVRGFEEDRLATEIIEDTLPPLGNVTQLRILPAGGNIRFIHNLDFQIEVWSVFGFPVTSAIFFDTGLVSNSLDGFQVRDLRHAVGLSLFRWTLPVGALSVEYAVPLDPKIGDNPRGRFHFNLGLLF